MARLDVRPVACQVAESGWSQVLILSESADLNAVPGTPTWIIALSLNGNSAAQTGPDILATLSEAYRQIELKTPESLYRLLEDTFLQQQNSSVAAACFSPHQMTLFGQGTYQIQLCRHDSCGTVLVGENNPVWQVVEGTWQESDRWSLAAGEIQPIDINAILSISNLEQAAETLHGQLAAAPISLANALIHITADSLVAPESTPTFSLLDPSTLKKRRVMAVGLLLLAILILSIWFGSKARTEQQHAAAFAKLETTVNAALATAVTLKATDQTAARQQVRELQTTISESKTQFGTDKKWLTKWEQLHTAVANAYQQLAGETAVTSLPEWFSLSIINPNLVGDKLAIAGDNVLILDKKSSSLVKIGLNTKKGELLVSGNTLANPKTLAASTAKSYILTNTGVIETVLSKKTSSTLIETDTEWLDPELLAAFNGNVYLLDKGATTIWRYPATAAGLGSKQTWFGNGVTLPSGQINALAVDGDVWLLRDGSVVRFRRGAPLSFTLTGLDQLLSANTPAFSVSSDQDKIAILDAGNQRIVLFNKKGEYQKQIQWSGLSQAKDIVFTADGSALFILADGHIYQTSL